MSLIAAVVAAASALAGLMALFLPDFPRASAHMTSDGDSSLPHGAGRQISAAASGPTRSVAVIAGCLRRGGFSVSSVTRGTTLPDSLRPPPVALRSVHGDVGVRIAVYDSSGSAAAIFHAPAMIGRGRRGARVAASEPLPGTCGAQISGRERPPRRLEISAAGRRRSAGRSCSARGRTGSRAEGGRCRCGGL